MPGEPVVVVRFLSVREAAERLGLKSWSIYQMVAAEILPVHRTGPKGRTLRISEADLVNYLAGVRTPASNGDHPNSRPRD